MTIGQYLDNIARRYAQGNATEQTRNYGKATKMEDPIIHFYETFLSEYDPKLRKARGVWYTPASVVSFILRAVDEVLKTEFGLPSGAVEIARLSLWLRSAEPGRKLTNLSGDIKVGNSLIDDPASYKAQSKMNSLVK